MSADAQDAVGAQGQLAGCASGRHRPAPGLVRPAGPVRGPVQEAGSTRLEHGKATPRGAERTVFVLFMEQIGTGRYREDEGDAFLPPGIPLSSEDFADAHAGAVFGNSVGPLPLPVR
nr:hypothetical protein [Streptomyces antibioticus]